MSRPPWLRRLLRYGAVAFAALALIYGVRAWEEATNDVTLRYLGAPPGEFEVTVRNEEGERLRRAHFAASVERQHVVQLPPGRFEATLRAATGEPVRRSFTVEGETTIELNFGP